MATRDDKDLGTRLADVRLPPYWPWSFMAALLLARRKESRELKQATSVAAELGQTVGQRWVEGDERERQLVALTRRVVHLTWAMTVLTVAVLGVTVWAILRG